jgi:hypothetical protein
MAAAPFEEIVKPKLLIGEGKEEVRFFESLLRSLGIGDVQVTDYAGKEKLRAFLITLPRIPGFAGLGTLGITRDADDNPGAAADSIRIAVTAGNLPAELRVSTYVMPQQDAQGALENLCIETISGLPIAECIERYLLCAEEAGLKYDRAIASGAKARIQAWLSVQERPGLRLGEAAEAGIIDWNSRCFDGLKEFLASL